MILGGAGLAGLVRGTALTARLPALWRHGAMVLALVLALAANAAPWSPSLSCAAADCLISRADSDDQAGNGVALLESFADDAAEEVADTPDGPPVPPVTTASDHRFAFPTATEPVPALASARDLLPGKTGPPRV